MTMATASLRSGRGAPSPLAVDLALATVDLAALRARRGVENLDEEAQEAALLLRDYYSRQLHAASTSGQISEEAVRDESVRRAIQQSLTLLTQTKPKLDDLDEDDRQLLEELVSLFSTLAERGCCKGDQAERLHSALGRLDVKLAAPSAAAERTKLSELLNAFS